MAPVFPAMRESGLTSLTQLITVQTPKAKAALRHLAGHAARRDYRILCLSVVGDSELMWSFYSDYHRGICLEFEGAAECFDGVEEVRYADAPPGMCDTDSRPIHAEALEKSSAWQYQQEWRMFSDSEYLPFPKSALKRVILGYRFPEVAFNPLMQSIVSCEYEVEIAQMQRPSNSYQFSPVIRERIGPTS